MLRGAVKRDVMEDDRKRQGHDYELHRPKDEADHSPTSFFSVAYSLSRISTTVSIPLTCLGLIASNRASLRFSVINWTSWGGLGRQPERDDGGGCRRLMSKGAYTISHLHNSASRCPSYIT